MLVPDVMIALVELCRVIAAPGETVAFATLVPAVLQHAARGGREASEIGLLADGSLDMDGLDAALDAGARALVLASPHNPTGRVLRLSGLEAIAERCAEREAGCSPTRSTER